MRYLDILMFVFCINVAIFLMAEIGLFTVFGGYHVITAEETYIRSFNQSASTLGINWSNPSVLDFTLATGVTVWSGIVTLFTIFASIVLLAPTLVSLGVPANVALIISSPIYFIYLWGIAQFLTGRSGRNIE